MTQLGIVACGGGHRKRAGVIYGAIDERQTAGAHGMALLARADTAAESPTRDDCVTVGGSFDTNHAGPGDGSRVHGPTTGIVKEKAQGVAESLSMVAPSDVRALFAQATVESAAMARALARIVRYARHERALILLEGESGTGKSTLARFIHAQSSRAAAPFVVANMAAIEDALAGAELFGHARGAFTGAVQSRAGLVASAQRGSLFLDEIGKASLHVQHRLLSLLEERRVRAIGTERDVPVDVRLIAATNVSLDALVAADRFLPDLLARLGYFRVRVPSLRERVDDIPALARELVQRHFESFGYREAPALHADLVAALLRYEWKGNVRELDAVVQRLLADAEGAGVLELRHCLDDLRHLRHPNEAHSRPRSPREMAEAVVACGSIRAAAEQLGVARSTVQRQLRRLNSAAPSSIPPAEVARPDGESRHGGSATRLSVGVARGHNA